MSLIIAFFAAFFGIIYSIVSIGKSNTRVTAEKKWREERDRNFERFRELCVVKHDRFKKKKNN